MPTRRIDAPINHEKFQQTEPKESALPMVPEHPVNIAKIAMRD
jgi:hypothetical protein